MDHKEYMSMLGKRSSSRLTPEQRKQRAINAARKRWGDANGKQEAYKALLCIHCGKFESYHGYGSTHKYEAKSE